MTLINEEIMGQTHYSFFSEVIIFDDSLITAYGISAMSAVPDDYYEVRGITTDPETASRIYDAVIRNSVMPVHIKDVISDMIS